MTVEVSTYISQLNSALPAVGDLKSEGDEHIRKIKANLLATFPNLTAAAVTATTTELNYLSGVTSNIQAQIDSAVGAGSSWTQTGTGAVTTTISAKLKEVVSIKDFGASPSASASANYTAIQAALDSGAKRVIVPADGTYTINAEVIPPTGVILEGQTGAKIVQDTYGYAGVMLRYDYSGVKNLTIENLQTKTALSTTVANRYDGEVQRSRASGIYVNAEYCVIEDVYCPGFINGINFVGGDRIWTTTAGTFTATTLVLNATSAQSTGYYVGWQIRIFNSSTATDTITVSAYDGPTNTVTFPTVSTFSGTIYYSLIGPNHTGNRVSGFKGKLNDFGILAQYQSQLTLDDIDQLSIEQTQEINARPHTVYVAATVSGLSGSRWRTYSCPNGHAYKLRTVTNGVLNDLSAHSSRAVLAIEDSTGMFVSDVVGMNIGTDTYRPEAVNIVSSSDININNVKLRIATAFDYASDTALRVAGVVIGDSSYTACSNLSISNVDVQCAGSDIGYAVLLDVPSTGTHSTILLDNLKTVGNGTCSTGATIPYSFRAFSVTGLKVDGLKHYGSDTPLAKFETTATSSFLTYETNLANPTVTNSGASNIVRVDGVETGTFTPVLYGGTVAGTNTYSAQVGQYEKVGKVVTVRIRITLTSLASTGSLRISGLPYAVAQMSGAVNMNPTGVLNGYSGITLSANNIPVGCAVSGQSRIDLYGASNTAFAVIDASLFSGTAAFQLSLTYITS